MLLIRKYIDCKMDRRVGLKSLIPVQNKCGSFNMSDQLQEVSNYKRFIRSTDSAGQEFQNRTVGRTYCCSVISEASVEDLKSGS